MIYRTQKVFTRRDDDNEWRRYTRYTFWLLCIPIYSYTNRWQ